MKYTYLYDFNKERYQTLGEQAIPCKMELSYEIVEDGYLLPKRYADGFLFGNGGVLDANKKCVEAAQMISYAKYTKVLEETDEKEIYLGGAYSFDENSVAYLDEEVVYLGYLSNHWGHFLTDSTTRLYTFLENADKSKKYAYLLDEGSDGTLIENVERFLELLGIREQIVFISQVTYCPRIIIPEQAYVANCYYSKAFLNVFEKVVSSVDCQKYPVYRNVYFSRRKFKKARQSEVGEEILLNLFKKNGFRTISPEQCTLDEQIAIIRNASCVAGIIGTLTHNLLFAQPEKQMLIINKTHNFNMIQRDINQMCRADVIYIDAYLAKFGVSIGDGPFLLYYSEPLDRFVRDYKMHSIGTWYKGRVRLKRNSKRYERQYHLKVGKHAQLRYGKNKDRYNYFAPEHLQQYEKEVAMEKEYGYNGKIRIQN